MTQVRATLVMQLARALGPHSEAYNALHRARLYAEAGCTNVNFYLVRDDHRIVVTAS